MWARKTVCEDTPSPQWAQNHTTTMSELGCGQSCLKTGQLYSMDFVSYWPIQLEIGRFLSMPICYGEKRLQLGNLQLNPGTEVFSQHCLNIWRVGNSGLLFLHGSKQPELNGTALHMGLRHFSLLWLPPLLGVFHLVLFHMTSWVL